MVVCAALETGQLSDTTLCKWESLLLIKMVLTIKVWTLIWDAWDECVHRRNAVTAKTGLVVCEESKHRAFGSPGIIELVGYVFWFPGFLVGPAIALRDYRRLSCVRDGRLSVVIVPALRRFALAWALVALNLLGPSRLPHEIGDLFNGLSPMVWWPCMLAYCYLLNQCFKAKFYYVWLMSEGAALAMGNSEVALVVDGDKLSASTSAHGHQGRDQAHEHSNVMSNVDIWQVETAPTMQVIMRHWNTKTHHWLKHYVYVRVMQMSSSERASPRLRLAASFATYNNESRV